ncbi:MAG TPA: PAS domain S-box protein, partial [Stellaceae bacterium]
MSTDPISGERRFQLLVEAATDYAIYMLDPHGVVSSWNSGAQRITAYTAGEALGQNFSHFFTPEDRERGKPEQALRIAGESGRYQEDGWRLRKDGTRFWASSIINRISDEKGNFVGFAEITRDITDRRAAGEALAESEQRFRTLIEGVVDYAIFMLDASGHVTSWNAGARRINGYTSGEIIGQHFSRFYTEEDRAAGAPARVLHVAAAGKYEEEGWRIRKDGTRFWASVVIDPIRDAGG